MSVSVTWAMSATVAETLPNNTGSAADASRVVTHTNYNESGVLNAGTTVPATQCAHFLLALSAGAAAIDFTNLTGTNGKAVDGTGLKVQLIRIKNLGADPMTFTEGASNGLALLGPSFSVLVPPGGVMQWMLNDGSPDIASGDKTVDVTGTGSQTAEVTIVMG